MHRQCQNTDPWAIVHGKVSVKVDQDKVKTKLLPMPRPGAAPLLPRHLKGESMLAC
jgi:hypothetical protein